MKTDVFIVSSQQIKKTKPLRIRKNVGIFAREKRLTQNSLKKVCVVSVSHTKSIVVQLKSTRCTLFCMLVGDIRGGRQP